jgi:hypothetical protein
MLIYLYVNSAFASVASLDFGVFGGRPLYYYYRIRVIHRFRCGLIAEKHHGKRFGGSTNRARASTFNHDFLIVKCGVTIKKTPIIGHVFP